MKGLGVAATAGDTPCARRALAAPSSIIWRRLHSSKSLPAIFTKNPKGMHQLPDSHALDTPKRVVCIAACVPFGSDVRQCLSHSEKQKTCDPGTRL